MWIKQLRFRAQGAGFRRWGLFHLFHRRWGAWTTGRRPFARVAACRPAGHRRMNSGLWASGRSSLFRDDACTTRWLFHSSAEADDRPEAHRRDFNRRPGRVAHHAPMTYQSPGGAPRARDSPPPSVHSPLLCGARPPPRAARPPPRVARPPSVPSPAARDIRPRRMNSGLWACGRSSLCRDDAFTNRRLFHSSAEADDRPEAHRRDFNRRPRRPCNKKGGEQGSPPSTTSPILLALPRAHPAQSLRPRRILMLGRTWRRSTSAE